MYHPHEDNDRKTTERGSGGRGIMPGRPAAPSSSSLRGVVKFQFAGGPPLDRVWTTLGPPLTQAKLQVEVLMDRVDRVDRVLRKIPLVELLKNYLIKNYLRYMPTLFSKKAGPPGPYGKICLFIRQNVRSRPGPKVVHTRSKGGPFCAPTRSARRGISLKADVQTSNARSSFQLQAVSFEPVGGQLTTPLLRACGLARPPPRARLARRKRPEESMSPLPRTPYVPIFASFDRKDQP